MPESHPHPGPSLATLLAGPLRAALEQALPAYLARQRWFGAKTRTIASTSIAEAMPCEQESCCLTVVNITFAEGDIDRYQLPLGCATSSAAAAVSFQFPKAIIHTLTIDGESAVVYDAVYSEPFRARLLALTDADAEKLPSRLSSAEQSNTSILYGDRFMLKLYRRLQPGTNPDVEIPRFLTTAAHFAHIPAYEGHLEGADGSTLTFLQAFAPNQGDGWQWMLERLTAESESRSIGPKTASLQAAALLGRRTAEMHLALATKTEDPAFSAESFTPSDLAADASRISAQIATTLDTLKLRLPALDAQTSDGAASLISQRKQLLQRAHAVATLSPHRSGCRIRIHGDYHLGQVLRTADDFLIVDFEGEPARPLEERRRKQSPLRDVAGMMRSFSYAAFTAQRQHSSKDWASQWEDAAVAAFLGEYRLTASTEPGLQPQADQSHTLLTALLLEKAMYELLYELNNRPDWLHIPLNGVLSLLREAA